MTFLWILGIIVALMVGYFLGAFCATCSEMDQDERISDLYWALRILVDTVEQLDADSALDSVITHAKNMLKGDNR